MGLHGIRATKAYSLLSQDPRLDLPPFPQERASRRALHDIHSQLFGLLLAARHSLQRATHGEGYPDGGSGRTDGLCVGKHKVENLNPHGCDRKLPRRTDSILHDIPVQSYMVVLRDKPRWRSRGNLPNDTPPAYAWRSDWRLCSRIRRCAVDDTFGIGLSPQPPPRFRGGGGITFTR